MNCLRCGAQVEAPNVFCAQCQAEMARHPVPRDAAVILPTREPRTPRKVYTPVDPQEQLGHLKRKNRRLGRALAVFVTLCVLLLGLLAFAGVELWKTYPAIGQNYKSNTSSSAPKNDSSPTR